MTGSPTFHVDVEDHPGCRQLYVHHHADTVVLVLVPDGLGSGLGGIEHDSVIQRAGSDADDRF